MDLNDLLALAKVRALAARDELYKSTKKPATLKLAGFETIEIDAYTTPTPGLIVHREVVGTETTGKWVVSHETSGLMVHVTRFDTRKEAMFVADALSELGDWTESASALNRPGLRDDVASIFEACTPEVLKAMEKIRAQHGQ
jgi:hypothetical protein